MRGDVAVVEMARASGLALVAAANDPLAATTHGTGELIRAALDAGAERILVAVGGSATTDGGLGALEALDFDLRGADVEVACDVTTTFVDAARVYGPQKGADVAMVAELERRLEALAERYRVTLGVDVRGLPGAGAAGGLAGGLAAAGARLVPGAALVANVVGLREKLSDASLAITGEGRLDATSLAGKVVGHVLQEAGALRTPVAVVAGDVEPRRLPPDVPGGPSSSARARRRSPSGTRRPSLPTPPSRSSARPEPHLQKSVDPWAGFGEPHRDRRARPGCWPQKPRTQGDHTHMPQLIDTGNARRTAASPAILTFPGDPGWDEARRAWNLAVDQRPAAVALPETVDDVVAAVDYARTVGLRVAVQGTGHGARHDLLDGTLLVNMARMTGVEIDAEARVARVAAGTIWIDVVDAAIEHGLTALHGSSQDVGVVGYSLGGGIGWLARTHGLSSSSVLSAQVVTAEGEVVRADAETNPDLFWALRGGGGSFGVVTEVEIALYPVTEAYAGWLIWPMERAGEVLGAWAEWTRDVPAEVTSIGRMLQLPPIPDIPEILRGRQVVVVEAAYQGDEASGRELLAPLLALEPEIDTFATVPARALTELHQDPPAPVPGVSDGWLLDSLDARGAAAIAEAARMDGTAPLISVEIRHLDGAVGTPDPNGGVLSHLEAPYAMFSVGVPMGPVTGAAIEERIGELRASAEPWLSRSTYFNFTENDVDPTRLLSRGRLRAARGDPRGGRPRRALPLEAHDLASPAVAGGGRSRPRPTRGLCRSPSPALNDL